MPQHRPDGSFHPGVMDANKGNTDQVPVYIEDHSKGTWGMREDHTRMKGSIRPLLGHLFLGNRPGTGIY